MYSSHLLTINKVKKLNHLFQRWLLKISQRKMRKKRRLLKNQLKSQRKNKSQLKKRSQNRKRKRRTI